MEGRRSLELLLVASKRLNTAYILKESFGQPTTRSRPSTPRRDQDHLRLKALICRLDPL
jgi:hypothetical protein